MAVYGGSEGAEAEEIKSKTAESEMPLDKLLREPSKYNCYGYKHWTPEYLEKAFKIDSLNEEDISEIYRKGYQPVYKEGRNFKGLTALWLSNILIEKSNPREEMLTFVHELLHLTFWLDKKNCGYYPLFLPPSFEDIIEKEAERIYQEDPRLCLHVQALFNFPEGVIYPNPK